MISQGRLPCGTFDIACPNAIDKAQEYLVKLNANRLRLYPEIGGFAPAFKSGKIDISIIWSVRAVMWENKDVPVKDLPSDEGATAYLSGMEMPKNAPDKADAYTYMNALLGASSQIDFAEHKGYLLTMSSVELTGKAAEKLATPKGTRLV